MALTQKFAGLLLKYLVLLLFIFCGCGTLYYPPKGDSPEEIAFNRIISLRQDRMYNTALVETEVFEKEYPNSKRTPLLLMMLAEHEERMGDNEDATFVYKKIVDNYPDYDGRNEAIMGLKRNQVKSD